MWHWDFYTGKNVAYYYDYTAESYIKIVNFVFLSRFKNEKLSSHRVEWKIF